MKKLFLLISVLAVSIAASAAVVTPERAMQVAQSFVPAQKTPKKNAKGVTATPASEIVYTHYMPKSGRPAIYVVNIGNAFAIVSADDVAHPILGYNYSKSWPTDGNIPPQVKSFFDDLAAQMEAASDQPQDTETAAEWQNPKSRKSQRRTQANDNLPDSVGPLLTTTWDQTEYYNALCPEDDQSPYDGRVLTGCVATAMAQIINYWGQQQTIHTRGIHSYQSNYGELTVNYDTTTYDFAHMPDALTSTNMPQEVNAVAKLMYHCGVAVNMGYGSAESSAYDQEARAALINFYKINPDASFAEKEFFTDEEWADMLRQEIAAGRPVYYSGRNEGSGHAFVCNGYQKDGYFYFNFGWSGIADGWYLPNATIAYNSNQTAIVGIQPNNTNNVILGQMQGTSTFMVDDPIEYSQMMGHNAYKISTMRIYSDNKVTFISSDALPMIVDLINYHGSNAYTNLSIYEDAETSLLVRSLNQENLPDMSPIVCSSESVTIVYSSLIYDDDTYKVVISTDNNCRMISNVTSLVDSTTVALTWRENGTAINWQVQYGEKGFSIGDGVTIVATDTTTPIMDLNVNTEYDFYMRPQCGGLWFGPVSAKTSEPNWLNAVQFQPEGYIVDENNIITISSAEGFAWLAKQANQISDYYNVKIVSDINLAGRLWIPIKRFDGNIDGCGHKIYNFHIDQMWAGLIEDLYSGSICNLGIESFQSKTAGLSGNVYNSIIKNCYAKDGLLITDETPAGLIGNAYESLIENCFSYNITSSSFWGGAGLIWALWPGSLSNYSNVVPGTNGCIVKNCYSELTFDNSGEFSVGVVAHYIDKGFVSNCYAINNKVIGSVAGYLHVTDTTSVADFDNGLKLRDTIQIDTTICTDLLTALNAEVRNIGDTTLRTWTIDNNTGYPIFGEYYSSDCGIITSLTARNKFINEEHCVLLTWEGSSPLYEIMCVAIDDCQPQIFKKIVSNNEAIITNLPIGKSYNIYVRSLCDDFTSSGWGNGIIHKVDKQYWQEVVIEEPEGYTVDNEGDVIISSAEGLAWFANTDAISGKQVHLINNIDLGRYKWKSLNDLSFCSINGNGHKISNLYCDEDESTVALFKRVYACNISNLIISGNVNAHNLAGGIAGFASGSIFNNCHSSVNATVNSDAAGSLIGFGTNDSIINCSASGDIVGYSQCGGLIGSVEDETIINCFATGNIIATSNPRDYHCHRGGLVGYLWGDNSIIRNCYATGHVQLTNYMDYEHHGALSGFSSMESEISNSYAKLDATNLWVHGFDYGLQYKYHDNTLFDNSGTLIDTVMINGILDTIMVNGVVYDYLLDALNAWVDANNSEGKYRHWVADTENVNGGFPIFDPTESPVTGIEAITNDQSPMTTKILRNGQIYILRSDKIYTLQGQEVK